MKSPCIIQQDDLCQYRSYSNSWRLTVIVTHLCRFEELACNNAFWRAQLRCLSTLICQKKIAYLVLEIGYLQLMQKHSLCEKRENEKLLVEVGVCIYVLFQAISCKLCDCADKRKSMLFFMTHWNCWQVTNHIELSYPEKKHICNCDIEDKATWIILKRELWINLPRSVISILACI